MNLVGTIGTKAVVTTFASQGIEIKHKNAILHRISELWMVTLARIVSMVVREKMERLENAHFLCLFLIYINYHLL